MEGEARQIKAAAVLEIGSKSYRVVICRALTCSKSSWRVEIGRTI